MDDLGLNCPVCEEYFSEHRPPKNLGCGHSVCGVCVNRILTADRKCPECRQRIKANSAMEMSINQPLLKLALSLIHGRRIETFRKSQSPDHRPSAPPMTTDPAEAPGSSSRFNPVDAGECSDHGLRLVFRCMTCKQWICETCLLSSHKAPPEGQCRTLALFQALQEMKEIYLQTSKSKVQFAEKLKRRLEKEVTSLDVLREQKSRVMSSLQSLLQESEIIVAACDAQREETSGRAASMQELIDLLKTRKERVKKAETLEEMESAMSDAEEVLTSVETRLLQEQHHRAFKIPVVTSLKVQDLRMLLDVLERHIFVSHISETKEQRWSRVSERDGLVHLHALTPLEEPPRGLILPYEVVRNMVPQASPSVFMDIAFGVNIRGRVYVRMFGNTVRAQQAVYLCSGEKGPSYKGTCFYRSENLDKPLEILRGGDYTNNNGSGGCAILNGITSGGVHKCEIMAGLMVGWPVRDYWRLGSFDFYLKDAKGMYDMSGYGIVTSGIEILRAAARHKPVHETNIKDCGLLIPI